jgi:hypothetical protein
MVKNRQEVLNMPRRKIPVPEPVPEKKPDPRKGVLTSRQKTFAQHVVEGVYSNSECARLAGYAAHCSNVYASKLLNGREYPHVVEYIQELREQRERRYGVTLIGQLQRLDELSRGAQDANQYSAAINAEKIRSALGGAKDPSSRQIVLFSGSKGPELIAKPYQEVQGSWFDGPAPLFEALRPEIEEHFRRVLRPAPCD